MTCFTLSHDPRDGNHFRQDVDETGVEAGLQRRRRRRGCAINVIGQYRPAYRAAEYPELTSRLPRAEIARLRGLAEDLGPRRVD